MSLFSLNTIYDEAGHFLNSLMIDLQQSEVDLKHWDIDHLCYRVETQAQYFEAQNLFKEMGQLLIESPVNGRMISTYKLHKPIRHSGRTIDIIELPAPKAGKITITGFEHIEVVVDETLTSLSEKYYRIPQDKGGLRKDFNAELELIFSSGALKFHYQSLESVVRIEKNQKISNFLNETQILNQLQEYHPLLAGTFPLDLNVEKSDLDILCDCRDLSTFCKEIEKLYSNHPNFNIQKTNVRGETAAVINWTWQDLPIEVFAQSTQSCRQWGFKHFQIEDRILKLAGFDGFQSIQKLRNLGLKTEPAFWVYLTNNKQIDFASNEIEKFDFVDMETVFQELYEASFLSENEILSKYKNIFINT